MCRDGIGAEIEFNASNKNVLENLFAEKFYGAIWAVKPEDAARLESACKTAGDKVKAAKLGITKKGVFKINKDIEMPVQAVVTAYGIGLGPVVGRDGAR
jgi:hypothetical protein